MVRDVLQLEMLVYFPALTEGLSVHSDGMDTSTELARYLRQRAETFTVDVLLLPEASGLAAPLKTFAADTVGGDVCKSWSRARTTTRDECAFRLVILSEVDNVGSGGWFGLCSLRRRRQHANDV